MVVNRKQPVAPVPPVQSRSTSQQTLVTRKKQSKQTANGINSHKPPSTSPDPLSKSRSRPRPRKKSLRDKLFAWSLSLFVVYSFLFCSPYTTTFQNSQSRLICRVESDYRTYFLDPFILPPLKRTLSLTHSLAKPYISQANTHLEPYFTPVKQVTSTVKPYVIQAVTTTKHIWEATLIPFYKSTLKPYYQSAILPRYNLYLRPHLLPLVRHLERYYAYYVANPIRNQFNRVQHFSTLYTIHVHSYISHLQPYIRRFASTVHTTWLTSVYFYGTYIQPTLQSTWSEAQPHLSYASNKAKNISLNAAAGSAKHLKRLANQVGTQRRTYVDPHIRKIWDKVEENATTKTTVAIPSPVDISLVEETAESTIVSSLPTDTNTNSDTLPVDVPVTGEDAQETAESTIISSLPTDTNANSDTLPIDVPVTGEDAQTILQPAESTPPLASASAPGGVIGVGASSSSPSDSPSTGEDDLDDFLRDIGIDTSSSPPPSPSPTPSEPSEAEKAAASAAVEEAEASRLASIEAKRQAIISRHTKFETDLQSSILTSTSQIIDKLTEMREDKKEELKHMIEGSNEGETGFVEGLTLSGDKMMKGLDIYLKKCEGRSGTWKQRVVENDDDDDIQKRTGIAKDEQTRLESVIEKVEIKFSDAVQKLQEQVNEWYSGMIKNEHQEIYQVTNKIKTMAEQAQADLGLDYAWLESVTYLDWQRYHDLMRAFENFEQTAHAIQNGTSVEPPSPPNPVIPVINDLFEEVQTVILGFNFAVGNVKNTIPELFSIHESVPERDDSAGADGEQDKVRIQPIDPDVDRENGKENEEDFDVSKVIIGKSKEQIEQALGDVPLVKHEEL